MKTKITTKNKNVINIKINTDRKKKKRNRAVKQSNSAQGKSSFSSGYSTIPPIVIQPQQPAVFPHYHQPQFISNKTQEPVSIKEPVISIKPEPVDISKQRLDKFNYIIHLFYTPI